MNVDDILKAVNNKFSNIGPYYDYDFLDFTFRVGNWPKYHSDMEYNKIIYKPDYNPWYAIKFESYDDIEIVVIIRNEEMEKVIVDGIESILDQVGYDFEEFLKSFIDWVSITNL